MPIAATGAQGGAAGDRAQLRGQTPGLLPGLVGLVILTAPGWILFGVNPRGGLVGPVTTSGGLAVLVALTWWHPKTKLLLVRSLQRFVINPPVRLLLATGVLPIGLALLETTGRRSGQPRLTPVGNGRDGNTFWIVAEHGLDANYVRNIEANPNVRIKFRHGWRGRWRHGRATILLNDDPYARQRLLCRKNPVRLINSAVVRVMATDPVTVRIDLDATTGLGSSDASRV